MGRSTSSVLVVDDYAPWRRFIRLMLLACEQLQIIGEVCDGLEAVQRAQELQPDLILLDIGLPHLNGIEAARQIRKLSPNSKIIFVTQECSADVVQETLNIGARGFVAKTDATSELPAAVTAVLRGEQFVGSRFAGHDFTGVSKLRTADGLSPNAVHTWFNPTALQKAGTAHRHEVQFYSDDESFLHGMTQFIGTVLKTGSAVIVLATESHQESLFPRLQAHGIEMTAAVDQQRYLPYDSVDILSRFMVDDVPDPIRFFKLAADLIYTASRGTVGAPIRVFACGELAPLLLKQGKPESAIQLEQLWDQLVKRHALDTLCTYSLSSFHSENGRDVFERICAQHSAVYSR